MAIADIPGKFWSALPAKGISAGPAHLQHLPMHKATSSLDLPFVQILGFLAGLSLFSSL
jgi:hypothetical protein